MLAHFCSNALPAKAALILLAICNVINFRSSHNGANKIPCILDIVHSGLNASYSTVNYYNLIASEFSYGIPS